MSKTQKQKKGSKEPTTPCISKESDGTYRVYIDRVGDRTHRVQIYIGEDYVGMWAGLPRLVEK